MCATLQPSTEKTDPLLRPFLQAKDAAEAQRLLGELISNHVQPLAREIARFRLRNSWLSSDGHFQEADDICSEVTLQLLARLQELRHQPSPGAIISLRGYVAAMVHHSCNHYVRRKFPERSRLKNKLRYVLNHRPGLALWEDESGRWLCGFNEWKDRGDRSAGSRWPPQTAAELERVLRVVYARAGLREMRPDDLLDTLFLLSKRPFELEELVGLVADVWGVHDLREAGGKGEESGEIWQSLPDPRVDVAGIVERRFYLAALWDEIRELRPRQRAALLLNLRDRSGQDMLPMLVLVGVTTLGAIADALDMPMEEFTELWDRLPLEDAMIATRLGITRQQVINLRKSARERLARRMASY
jgi:DNA-directed RNA polymerase specialized sigma24 family protein